MNKIHTKKYLDKINSQNHGDKLTEKSEPIKNQLLLIADLIFNNKQYLESNKYDIKVNKITLDDIINSKIDGRSISNKEYDTVLDYLHANKKLDSLLNSHGLKTVVFFSNKLSKNKIIALAQFLKNIDDTKQSSLFQDDRSNGSTSICGHNSNNNLFQNVEINKIKQGRNISNKFLLGNSKNYQIFRYNGFVYAIQNNTNKFIKLWNSKNGSGIKKVFLSDGKDANVYGKNDRAIREEKSKLNGRDPKINEELLDLKFKLDALNVSKYFSIGLWKNDNTYITQYIAKGDLKSEGHRDEFICALKQFNDLGYYHTDLASSPSHSSLQNIINSNNGDYIACDISYASKITDDKKMYYDQWLWYANGNYNQRLRDIFDTDENSIYKGENKYTLNTLYANGDIYIPEKLLTELKIQPNNLYKAKINEKEQAIVNQLGLFLV